MVNPIKMICMQCHELCDGFQEHIFTQKDVLVRRITYMHVQPDGQIIEHVVDWRRIVPRPEDIPKPTS